MAVQCGKWTHQLDHNTTTEYADTSVPIARQRLNYKGLLLHAKYWTTYTELLTAALTRCLRPALTIIVHCSFVPRPRMHIRGIVTNILKRFVKLVVTTLTVAGRYVIRHVSWCSKIPHQCQIMAVIDMHFQFPLVGKLFHIKTPQKCPVDVHSVGSWMYTVNAKPWMTWDILQ